jgi:hypothetical protein
MGLTFNCAQCHTHKYDPISNREYYQFLAIFNQTEDNDQPDERPTMPLPTKEQQARVDQLKSEIAKSEKEFANPTPEFLADLAEWENIQKRGIDWTVLEPTEIQSANGATLRTLEDKSILAEGTSPDKDTYTLKARAGAGNITAVRLEVLPDESLPKNGPGRGMEGKFVLNTLRLSTQNPGTESAIRARGTARRTTHSVPGGSPGLQQGKEHRSQRQGGPVQHRFQRPGQPGDR